MLSQTRPTLPTSYYLDPDHYRRELGAIWYREWICIARRSELQEPGDYLTTTVGEQSIILVRNERGDLHAFFNTCRHRGSRLCGHPVGRLPNQRIVCPYHAWTYSLDGDLVATPRRVATADFDAADYSLYPVAVAEWQGFVFVNLASDATDLDTWRGRASAALDDWPLAGLALAHRERHSVACNWKLFWENFSECYHCPGLHPELCRVVPVYGQGFTGRQDLPEALRERYDPRAGPLAPGATTWTLDGQTELPPLDGLSAAQQAAGMTFVTLHPSMFVVAHVDYVRTVRVLPCAPQRIELIVDWLLPEASLQHPAFDLEKLTALGRLVVTQDAAICEVNQRGLGSLPHAAGVLMPQEYGVADFHDWVLERLGSDA